MCHVNSANHVIHCTRIFEEYFGAAFTGFLQAPPSQHVKVVGDIQCVLFFPRLPDVWKFANQKDRRVS